MEIYDLNLKQTLYRHLSRSENDEEKDMLVSVVLPILLRSKNSTKGINDAYMVDLLQTLSVSRQIFGISSLLQIVNHGISFGEHVSNEILTDEILKRLSQGRDHVRSLSIIEMKNFLKYLNNLLCFVRNATL